MIFIVQMNKVPREKYEFINIRRLQNFSTVVQSILCPSDTLIEFSNRLLENWKNETRIWYYKQEKNNSHQIPKL